jgi:predicted MFS family arabinose efflux permease
VPLLHATIGIVYWQLLVLAAINGALRTPAVTASLVMLREATGVAGLSIEQTTGLYAASVRLASTLGAPVAGALIAFVGALGVLVVDAVTFFLSATLVWWLIAPPDLQPAPTVEPEPAARTGLSNVVQGFAVLRRDRVLLLLTLLAILWAVTLAGWSSVAAPIYGQGVLDSSIAMGFLLGAFGAGALLGNMSYPALSRRFRRYTILGVALVVSGPVLWVALAVQPPLEILIPVATLAGLGFGMLPPLYLTLLYARVATTQQGHVFGVTFALESAGQALGGALAGLVLTYATLQATLLGMGVVTGAFTVAALRAVPLRELRHRGPIVPTPVTREEG